MLQRTWPLPGDVTPAALPPADSRCASRPDPLRGTGRLLLMLALAGLAGGCSLVARPMPPSGPPPPPGTTQEGIASWYGQPFHGRRTASGEVYDMEAPTAAHRTLPFGTRVRVHNLETGRSTVLRINDRGPFVRGRIIDVSRRGARELGLLEPGIARVRVEILELPGSSR